MTILILFKILAFTHLISFFRLGSFVTLEFNPFYSDDDCYHMRDISEVRNGFETDIFNKLKSNSEELKKLDNFSQDTSFSIIFKPECNKKELDLVAESEEVRDCWVNAIRHSIGCLSSLGNQKEYELFLKEKFRKADTNKSGYLSFGEIKKLARTLNIKIEESILKKVFDEANEDKQIKIKDRGQVLDENEFVTFYYKLMRREEIDELFLQYTDGVS